jgi:hypothetical protein
MLFLPNCKDPKELGQESSTAFITYYITPSKIPLHPAKPGCGFYTLELPLAQHAMFPGVVSIHG